MIQDRVAYYSQEMGMNCAESILHAAAEEWGLDLDANTYKALGCFGGGMGCGNLCGALAGSVAAIGLRYIDQSAHQSPHSRKKAAEMVRRFNEEVGGDLCKDLSKQYRRPDVRCLPLITIAARILDQVTAEE